MPRDEWDESPDDIGGRTRHKQKEKAAVGERPFHGSDWERRGGIRGSAKGGTRGHRVFFGRRGGSRETIRPRPSLGCRWAP